MGTYREWTPNYRIRATVPEPPPGRALWHWVCATVGTYFHDFSGEFSPEMSVFHWHKIDFTQFFVLAGPTTDWVDVDGSVLWCECEEMVVSFSYCSQWARFLFRLSCSHTCSLSRWRWWLFDVFFCYPRLLPFFSHRVNKNLFGVQSNCSEYLKEEFNFSLEFKLPTLIKIYYKAQRWL